MKGVQPSLRVVLLTTSFPLSRGSRSGIFIKKMVENLPDPVQVTVLTPDSSSEPAAASEQESRFTLVRFRYAPKNWQQLAHGSGGIVAALSQRQPVCLLIPVFLCAAFLTSCRHAFKADVLHANWSINGVIAGVAGLLTRTPVITTLRGSDVNLMEKSWLMRQLVSICFRLSSSIVTVSPSLQSVLCSRFPLQAPKVQVIANGIDPAFGAAKKGADALPDVAAPVRLLSVGNLTTGKRVQLILKAVAALGDENWSLDIVGDGPEQENLEAFCQREGIASMVSFHGSVAPEDMPLFMGRADVFVFASVAEGRPNVVLEAMASCLPVIAAAIPAVEELIEDGLHGLLFTVDDVDGLRSRLEQLVRHPEQRLALGTRAAEAIQSRGLSWQETAKQYTDLYTRTAVKAS